MNLRAGQENGRCQRMYWCVPPPFIVEASSSIEMVKIIAISARAPKVEVSNFEIRPKVASVEGAFHERGLIVGCRGRFAIHNEGQAIVGRNILWMCTKKVLRRLPECRHGIEVSASRLASSLHGLRHILGERDYEAVFFVVLPHKRKRITIVE